MVDGKLYTGSYHYKQWIIKEVVPHHDDICVNCKEGGGGSTEKFSTMKRKAELCAQISDLEFTKRWMISDMKTRPSEDDKPKSGGCGIVIGSRAGTEFGGCAEKTGNK